VSKQTEPELKDIKRGSPGIHVSHVSAAPMEEAGCDGAGMCVYRIVGYES